MTTKTTEQRFKSAVKAVRGAGVIVRQNVQACCRGCVTPEQIGVAAEAALAGPHAWTFGGQGGAYSWRDGEAVFRNSLRQSRSRYTTRRAEPVDAVYFYHGGPGLMAAQAVADAFRAEGFRVAWDGTEFDAVAVQMGG